MTKKRTAEDAEKPVRPCGLRDLFAQRLPLGEATGATQRNKSLREFLGKS
ncbi:hypothetical protein [Nostoc sp.]